MKFSNIFNFLIYWKYFHRREKCRLLYFHLISGLNMSWYIYFESVSFFLFLLFYKIKFNDCTADSLEKYQPLTQTYPFPSRMVPNYIICICTSRIEQRKTHLSKITSILEHHPAFGRFSTVREDKPNGCNLRDSFYTWSMYDVRIIVFERLWYAWL